MSLRAPHSGGWKSMAASGVLDLRHRDRRATGCIARSAMRPGCPEIPE
jgi:hypothetical protein